MTNKKRKNITLDSLAQIMTQGFIDTEKSTDKKINNLAGMVQRGFLDVDKRFDLVDKRFDKIDKRIDGVELEDHRKRIGRLEEQVRELQASFR